MDGNPSGTDLSQKHTSSQGHYLRGLLRKKQGGYSATELSNSVYTMCHL